MPFQQPKHHTHPRGYLAVPSLPAAHGSRVNGNAAGKRRLPIWAIQRSGSLRQFGWRHFHAATNARASSVSRPYFSINRAIAASAF